LPGSLKDTSDGKYAGACVKIDWTDNPCTVSEVTCGTHIMFDWEREPDGYFNLKFFNGSDVLSSTAGIVNPRQPPTTAPAYVSELPEGVDITVDVNDFDNNHYYLTFRRDGDVITIASIIKLAI